MDPWTKWEGAWQNQQNYVCTQWRLRSVWASAQSDQSLLCTLWVANFVRTANTLIRLGGCPGWSEFRWAHKWVVGFVMIWLRYEHCSSNNLCIINWSSGFDARVEVNGDMNGRKVGLPETDSTKPCFVCIIMQVLFTRILHDLYLTWRYLIGTRSWTPYVLFHCCFLSQVQINVSCYSLAHADDRCYL